jgi:hypothetical protein
MEGESKEKQGGEQKNPLLQTLEGILSGNEEIRDKLGTFTQIQQQLLSRLIEKETRLDRESAAIERLSKDISSKIVDNNRDNQSRLQEVFDTGLDKFRKIELGLSEKDRSSIEKIENIFRRFWKVPATISVVSLLMAALTTFMALKFYRESIKSKEEVRAEILAGWNSQGKRLVDGDEWSALNNERVIVQSFVRDDKSGGKALVNYRKGMVSANKGKAIYKDIDSDKVVKE